MFLFEGGYKKSLLSFGAVFFLINLSSFASAQDEGVKVNEEIKKEKPAAVQTLTGDSQIEDMVRRTQLNKPEANPDQISSLFFTAWEQSIIADARKGLFTRPPTEYEVEKAERELARGAPPPMGPRELSLGGIVYVSSGDWTLWLNGQKVTPKRLPPEILDIRVRKDHVKIKWYDAYTNQIFPVKLKTHQRFNIDTRLFLPG